jgi:threonine/homoserine/homoserine lactone efflux protein
MFIFLAVAGLAAIADALGPFFLLVKLAAGVYLIILGIGLLRASPRAASHREFARSSWLSSLSSGFLLTLGDPKAILGYMSLLPAFVELSNISIAGIATIMVLAAGAVGGAKACYVVLSERAVSMVESRRAISRVNILAGSILACVGLFLMTQSYLFLRSEARAL